MALKPLYRVSDMGVVREVDDRPGVREISAVVEVSWPGNVLDLSDDDDINWDVRYAEKARGLLADDAVIFDGLDPTDASELEGAIRIVMTQGPSWEQPSRGQVNIQIVIVLTVSILMPATRADLLLGRSALLAAVAAIVDTSAD